MVRKALQSLEKFEATEPWVPAIAGTARVKAADIIRFDTCPAPSAFPPNGVAMKGEELLKTAQVYTGLHDKSALVNEAFTALIEPLAHSRPLIALSSVYL